MLEWPQTSGERRARDWRLPFNDGVGGLQVRVDDFGREFTPARARERPLVRRLVNGRVAHKKGACDACWRPTFRCRAAGRIDLRRRGGGSLVLEPRALEPMRAAIAHSLARGSHRCALCSSSRRARRRRRRRWWRRRPQRLARTTVATRALSRFALTSPPPSSRAFTPLFDSSDCSLYARAPLVQLVAAYANRVRTRHSTIVLVGHRVKPRAACLYHVPEVARARAPSALQNKSETVATFVAAAGSAQIGHLSCVARVLLR